MEEFFGGLVATLSLYLPTLLAAIGLLIVGWLLAILISGLVRRLLHRTSLDDRIAGMLQGSQSPSPESIRVENWVGTGIFWLIIFFTVVAFLQLLNLTAISQPLSLLLNEILGYLPGLFSALLLLFIAWVIASILRLIVTRLLNASGAIRSLSEEAQVRPQGRVTLAQTLGNVVYWLVFLFFLPAILDALNLQGILAPVQNMVNEILGFLPNLLAAGIILAIGWLIARILRQIVTNVLSGLGIDNIGRDAMPGETGSRMRLSDVIGIIVYVLVLIPVAIAALNALNISAISQPASNMLNNLLLALPAIFGALILIGLAYFIGRIVGRFVATILSGIGFNRLFEQIGFISRMRSDVQATVREAQDYSDTTPRETPAAGMARTRITPADIVGYLVTIAIILFAVMEGADMLGFGTLSVLVSRFIIASTQVLVGLLIFGLGLYLAAMADRVIRESDMSQAYILAPAARIAIIVFAGALALREMGIAESIVNLAFGLLLGAVAVAAALAFGLGGRVAAERALDRWQTRLSTPPIPATGGASAMTDTERHMSEDMEPVDTGLTDTSSDWDNPANRSHPDDPDEKDYTNPGPYSPTI